MAKPVLGENLSEMLLKSMAKVEREEAEAEETRETHRKEHRAFLEKLLDGPDMLSWIVPAAAPDSDEVLAEHMAQLRNLVRYSLQYALKERTSSEGGIAASSTALRLIYTNIALAKALQASRRAKSKTVHSGAAKKEPQD